LPDLAMSVQLQYVQLITGKTSAADQQSGVFAIFIGVTRTKSNTKSIAVPQISAKTVKH